MTSNDRIIPESTITSVTTNDPPGRDASQQDLYPPADTSLKGPTVVEPEDTKQKARPRRRMLCYVCVCFWLTVVILVAAVLIFALAVFKTPQVAFQSLQPETTGAALLSALLAPGQPSSAAGWVRVNLVATVTNPNTFTIDLYGVDVGAYADAARQVQLANGTLATLRLVPGPQNLTVPLSLQVPTAANTLLRACAIQTTFPLHYSVYIGLSWIRWLTSYKYPVTGNISAPCPFNLNTLLSDPAAAPEIAALITRLPELLKKYLPAENITALYALQGLQRFLRKISDIQL